MTELTGLASNDINPIVLSLSKDFQENPLRAGFFDPKKAGFSTPQCLFVPHVQSKRLFLPATSVFL